MSNMYYYKNAKIEPAKNGYILCYDKYTAGGDQYNSMSFVGECKEVYDNGDDAIDAMDKITSSEMYTPVLRDEAKSKE